MAETYGEYLRYLRTDRKMTQTGLERISGVRHNRISQAELGKIAFLSDKCTEKIISALELTDREAEELRRLQAIPKNQTRYRKWDEEIHTETFGVYVKSLRLRRHMTQDEMGKLTGTYQSYIRAIEIGRNKTVRKDVLDMLPEILGLTGEETELLYALQKRDIPIARVWDGAFHDESFADCIRSARLRAGLSQEAVGNLLGVTKQAVSLAENGSSSDFARRNTDRLAEIFELSEDEAETLKRLANEKNNYIGKVRIFRKENSNEEHKDRLV